MIRAHLIGAALFFSSTIAFPQEENLVPNPSFEEYTACPYTGGSIWKAEPWTNRASVDYYHECGYNGFGVPISWGGGGYARTGQAYLGLGIRHLGEFSPEFREYAVVPLSRPLSATRYWVAFYVSFGDSSWYAGRNIGAYLSVNPPSENFDSILALEAQVKYTGNEFLTNKEGWTRIEGVYLAQGGESYLTIGNFDNDAESETVFIEDGGVLKPWAPDYWKLSYYYIDDVSVIDMDSLVGVEELTDNPLTNDINVYPNPVNDVLTVDLIIKEGETGVFELWNITGALMKQVNLVAGKNIVDVSAMLAGLYFFSVRVNLEQKLTGKQIIVR